MSMGRLRLRVGNNFRNCTDLNKKLLKTDQIKATVLSWQLIMNFKVCSFSQTFHIDLLTDEAMFMGWNPPGTKQYLPMKSQDIQCFRSPIDFKILFLNEPFWVSLFILLKTKVFLYSGTYRLHITADGPYHGWTSSTQIKYFLKTESMKSKHWLCCALGNQSQTPFPLKGLSVVC